MLLARCFALTLLFAAGVFSLSSAVADDPPPNVVVIFIDDMGYGDIGPFGAAGYPTPNLDQMAREGRRFTDFVVSSAVCSASRSALLTGCYHVRVGLSGALGPSANVGLSEQETTLAEICKQKGYATACFGKWHLGHHPRFLPPAHGFDQYYGIPYSNDMWPLHPEDVARIARNPNVKNRWPPLPMIEGTQVVNADVQPADQEQMTRAFTERATQFIRQHADEPFFVYLPHPMVHVPLYVSEAFKGKSGAGLFGDVVMELDWSVGQILQTLKDVGVDENTLVIFTSDNGPWLSYGSHAGSAGPFREGKGTMFEGGYREPTIMRWPGKIPAGSSCDELASTIDVLPTVAKLIGADLPPHKIDGQDIRPLMFGEPDALSPHEAFACYYGGGQLQAIRDRQYKLHFPHSYRTLDGRPGGTDGTPTRYSQVKVGHVLYDLKADPGETTDVAAQYPDVVARLTAAAEAVRADLGDKLQKRRGTGVRPIGKLTPQDKRLEW